VIGICIGQSTPPDKRIDFLLTAKRDAAAAKRFLRNAIEASGNPMPRVMNVDKNPAYPAAVEAVKADGVIPRRVELRQSKYLNNMILSELRVKIMKPVMMTDLGGSRVRRPRTGRPGLALSK
jgi:transposase-like protein